MVTPPHGPVAVRRSSQRREIEAWALVLSSQGIRSRVVESPTVFALFVSAADAERTERVLELYDDETAESLGKRARPPPPEYGRTSAGIQMAAALALLQLGIWSRLTDLHFMPLGSANGQHILDGEIWRTVTALCLHVDGPHLFGNVLALGLFASTVAWSFGPGVGALLIVLSGALGNWANAFVQGPSHLAVGASTAVFGAIGILAGLQAVRRWRGEVRKARAWLPLAGGLALLAMLGTSGQRVDVLAHLLGLLCGMLLGAAACGVLRRPATPAIQIAAALATVGLITVSWWLALTVRV
jgi:membrane associated rhomboid family serine protease